MNLTVRQTPFAELIGAPTFDALIREYACYSAIDGMPKPKPHMESYHMLDRSGLMTTFCAYVKDELIGFALLLVNILPHYSVLVANLESFFVAEKHRGTGAGLQLFLLAEDVARKRGAVGMLLAAAVNGQLDRVLARRKSYRKTHNAYFRSLA
jgi:GNAT superfamily N-acetyltransferase